MTAPSSQRLAVVLRAAGFERLAQRAELDEFHDVKSPHDLPDLVLDMELITILHQKQRYSQLARDKARRIRCRVRDGEFDATLDEILSEDLNDNRRRRFAPRSAEPFT